jgi:anti-anti-sigma factor
MKSGIGRMVGNGSCANAGPRVVQLTDVDYTSLSPLNLARVRRLLLQEAGTPNPQNLVIDLSRVQRFGASFLGVLVDTWDQLRVNNRRLILRGLTPEGTRLIQKLRLDKLFDVDCSSRSAMEVIRQPGANKTQSVVRIRESEVAWDSSLVRLEYIGEDGVPIRSVIVRRAQR